MGRSEYRNYPGVGMFDYKSFDPGFLEAELSQPGL